jgi:hypothetical protein
MCSFANKLYFIHHEISSEDIMIIQYADDFAILTKGKNTDDAMKKLKKAVADFVAQATELELSINGSKCAILIFGKQKTKETIEIDNATVKIAEKYRYLEITIDRHLHFGLHVKELHTALQRRLNLLKYIAGLKVLNILYKNFIRSKMEGYRVTAYGNAPKTRLQKFDTLVVEATLKRKKQQQKHDTIQHRYNTE